MKLPHRSWRGYHHSPYLAMQAFYLSFNSWQRLQFHFQAYQPLTRILVRQTGLLQHFDPLPKDAERERKGQQSDKRGVKLHQVI